MHENVAWDQLITFGTVYNGVERTWQEWLETLGAVLQRLDWDDAHV